MLVAFVSACGEATAPSRTTALCFEPPTLWVGVQNEGAEWRTVSSGPGALGIQLTERVIIARTIGSGGFSLASTLEFLYLTRAQAESTFTCATGKELTGSVAGLRAPDGEAAVAVGRRSVETDGEFTLSGVPEGPQDLVATHGGNVIVRRAQEYFAGTPIPALDFASIEAVIMATSNLTVNAGGLPTQWWRSDLFTHRGTRARLADSFHACCSAAIRSVPATRLESGDLHHLYVVAGTDADLRFADRFYTEPADQTIDMGPPANVPAFTLLNSGGQLWRVQLQSHPDYDGQVVIITYDPDPQAVTVIRATREYFGSLPASWTFTVPDLSRVAGFVDVQVLAPSTWECTESARPWLMPIGARAGDTYRSAYRHN